MPHCFRLNEWLGRMIESSLHGWFRCAQTLELDRFRRKLFELRERVGYIVPRRMITNEALAYVPINRIIIEDS